MPTDLMQSLSRAVAVLDCFSLEQPELGVREIARRTGLAPSVAGRLLAALRDLGILSQNSDTRTYAMGARPLSWAGVYTGSLDVRNQAMPALQSLHTETQETISLYILEGYERVCVERLESNQSVRVVTRLGRRLPLYAGAAGKVLLAYMNAVRREEFFLNVPLVQLTAHTICDLEALRRELRSVREQGVAVSFGEWIDDVAGVAAPILDHHGEALAALTISGPTQRFTPEHIAHYCDLIRRSAAQISTQMGYSAGAKYS